MVTHLSFDDDANMELIFTPPNFWTLIGKELKEPISEETARTLLVNEHLKQITLAIMNIETALNRRL